MSHEINPDPSGKEDLSGFQEGFLEECQAALDAGFEPQDVEPDYLDDEDDDVVNGIWEGAVIT